jgi:hypothetical protein
MTNSLSEDKVTETPLGAQDPGKWIEDILRHWQSISTTSCSSKDWSQIVDQAIERLKQETVTVYGQVMKTCLAG